MTTACILSYVVHDFSSKYSRKKKHIHVEAAMAKENVEAELRDFVRGQVSKNTNYSTTTSTPLLVGDPFDYIHIKCLFLQFEL